MAKSILVANWKNYPGSLEEAKALLKELAKKKDLYKRTRLYIAPPLPYVEAVALKTKGFAEVASQDLSLSKGTHTGEVGVEILQSFGVRLAILGHSERRALGETAEQVASKVPFALKSGLTPLICFGEKVRDAEGEHFQFLQEELKMLLTHVAKKEAPKIMLAYEPVWAIGKEAKGSIEPEELNQTILFIKKLLSDFFGRKIADQIPILYGGSVDAQNVGVLGRNAGVRGFLVGRASLNAKSFAEIASALSGT